MKPILPRTDISNGTSTLAIESEVSVSQRLGWSNTADRRAALLLLLSGILFFSDFLFTSKNFYFRDILNFHYPLRKVLIGSFAQAEFPLWNPFIYLGQPLLANPNYMAFYPTNLLHLLFSFNYAFKLHFVLHPLLAGLGIYFLQRRLGIIPAAAFGGALIYQFSGTVLSFLNLYNIVPAVALIPWIGWAFLVALETDSWRASLVAGLLLALQIVAFEPLLILCNFWLCAGLALIYSLQARGRLRAAAKVLRVAFVGGLFGVGLAALQIIPAVELILHSVRGMGYSYTVVSDWSMHPLDLVSAAVPNLFGNAYTINYASYWGEPFHATREPYLVSYFLGGTALLLCVFSFLSNRKQLQLTMAGLTIISVTLALGRFNPIYAWLYDHIFFFRLGRYPSKYFLLATLALSILAALGLEAVLRPAEGKGGRNRIVAAALLGLVMGSACLAAWLYGQQNPHYLDQWIRAQLASTPSAGKDFPAIVSHVLASVRSTGVFLMLASALILVTRGRRSILLIPLTMLILVAELVPANLRLSPLMSEADVNYVSEVNAYLRQNGPREPYRVVPPTVFRPLPDLRIQAPNASSAWLILFYRRSGQPMDGITQGIQYSVDRSVDDLNTRDSDDLWKACSLLPETGRLTMLQRLNSPVLLMIGELHDPRVHRVASFDTLSDQKLHLYWLRDTLARAYFVSGVERAASHGNALYKFLRSDFPVGDTVILEESRIQERRGETGTGIAKTLEYQNQRVRCEVTAKSPGYLVLLDSYYPGWRAYLDGKEVPILRANYAFRAVEVPAGSHEVEFRYQPRSFYAGLAVTTLALLAGVVSLFWRKRIQYRRHSISGLENCL